MLTLTKVVHSTSRSFEILSCRLFSSTPCLDRWHADKVANRPLRRFGFKDSVKMSGALPRISNDAPMIQTMRVFTPYNPWAPKRALGGQNDYIDILGADPDAIKPHEIHYHIPSYLRGLPAQTHNNFQMALKRKQELAETSFPKRRPYLWDLMSRDVHRTHNYLRRKMNQFNFSNYRGLTVGQAKTPFRTKYPF